MKNLKIYEEKRPWGNFRHFTHNAQSTVKIITVSPGEILSLQSHEKRAEFWKVVKGGGTVEIDGRKYEVKEGDEHEIPQGAKHRVSAGPAGLEILEISLGDFDENDIIRYEDKYGRK